MKVKDLVSLLLKNDQEAEVNFQYGDSDDERRCCARYVLADDGTGENDGMGCLNFMSILSINQELYKDSSLSEVNIILEQDVYNEDFWRSEIQEERERTKQ